MPKIDPDDPTFGETPSRHKKRPRKKTKEEKAENWRLWREKKDKYRKWLTEMFKNAKK